MEIYSVENLSFFYPEASKRALDNVSFSVDDGDFILLFGRSGCGKTTLLRHLKSVLTPAGRRQGKIYFMGKELSLASEKEQSESIGFVSQSPENQIVCDKVWHELAFGLESLGLPNDVIRARVAEMASFFGIENLFYRNTFELSGGQKQLLNLASVMVMRPRVLILDEPTSALDPIAAKDFLLSVSRINREFGTSVVMTEHRLDDVLPVCSKACFMENGSISEQGTPAEIITSLKQKGNTMLDAMPAPVRVWSALDGGGESPLTVNSGKQWLCEYARAHTVRPVKEDKPIQSVQNAVEVKDLWFRYEKDLPDVIRGLNLNVRRGEFYALLGGNGAGKSTVLKLLCGIEKPYSGKITVNISSHNDTQSNIALLPQEVQSLFVKKTVYEELCLALDNKKEKASLQSVDEVIALCHLEKLLSRHPFDLSGGEAQRVALAKLLIRKPKIIALDEPTKAMDSDFKAEFADIIEDLLMSGVTVIMVSHDIEFCAAHAHRCGMFFDGSVTSEGVPRKFFSENYFYTTAASRMSRDILEDAVSCEDIIKSFGVHMPERKRTHFSYHFTDEKTVSNETEKKKTPLWRRILFWSSFILAAFFAVCNLGIFEMPRFMYAAKYIPYITIAIPLLGMCIATALPSHKAHKETILPTSRKLSKRTVIASVMIIAAIPLTILFGVYYLGDVKYLFISLLVLLECMLPFFMVFEGRKPQARELVLIAVLCAIGVAARQIFYMLPQFKAVTAIVIISGVSLGAETGFLVGAVSMLVSNILFSQGSWTPWQMFAMGIIGFAAGLLYRKGLLSRNRASLCIFGFITSVAVYGGVMNFASAVISRAQLNAATIAAYYAAGFPMDIVHGIATALFLWLCVEPMLEKLDRVKVKYSLL